MRYCNMERNFTVALPLVKVGSFMIIEEKKLSGILGSFLHKYFDLDSKNLCKFVAVESFGIKLPNGSYTGSLKLLQDGKVDCFYRPEALFINGHEKFLEKSNVVYEDGFYSSHLLKKKISIDAVSLKMFEVELYIALFFMITFLILMSFLFIILPRLNFFKKAEMIAKNLLLIDFNLIKFSDQISLIILFYMVYFMICRSILVNNIKTNSVIVDTSEIVDSKEHLLKTKRFICFMKNEIEIKVTKSAPKNTFLYKLYKKAIEHNQFCTFTPKPKSFMRIDFDKSIVFANWLNLNGVASVIGSLVNNRYHYFNLKAYYNVPLVIYYRKGIDPYFKKCTNLEAEAGILYNIQKNLGEIMLLSLVHKLILFKSVKDYIDEFTEPHEININYLKDSLTLNLIANLIIVSGFLLHAFLKKFQKNKVEYYFENIGPSCKKFKEFNNIKTKKHQIPYYFKNTVDHNLNARNIYLFSLKA